MASKTQRRESLAALVPSLQAKFGSMLAGFGRANLSVADSGIGEEIADALGVIALRPNEKIVAPEMGGVFQRGGEKLVLLGLGFETQSFRPQGAIETEADLVGFAIEL